MSAGLRIGDWIWTSTGRQFWPRDPRPSDFCIEDIAMGCAKEPRFAGQTLGFVTYSVAQHEVLCCEEAARRLVPPAHWLPFPDEWERVNRVILRAVLVHDGAKGLGWKDLPAPVKHDPAMAAYRAGESRCQEALFDWACVGAGRRHPIIKEVDVALRRTEQRDLQLPIPPHLLAVKARCEPLSQRIVPWTAEEAYRRFLAKWEEVKP